MTLRAIVENIGDFLSQIKSTLKCNIFLVRTTFVKPRFDDFVFTFPNVGICPQKMFFWWNPYKTELMITSLIERLELPNFDHMTTSTRQFQSRYEIL